MSRKNQHTSEANHMHNPIKRLRGAAHDLTTLASATLLCCLMLGRVSAIAATQPSIANNPLFLSQSAKPEVLLTLSNDHQLYFKAYDDYSDLNNDGVPETTYDDAIDYYGYFDSYKCYTYDVTNNLFVPISIIDKANKNHYCPVSTAWSGNFLNWSTMARIDTVRKILYGGYRSTDSSTKTVLERTYLPNDAHSWAKFYDGTDLAELTPLSPSTGSITMCNTTRSTTHYSQNASDPPLMRVANGNFALWAANERYQCRWSSEVSGGQGVNSNIPAQSGINASSSSPSESSDGLGQKNYVVRVEACVSKALIGNEECTRYPDGDYKPTGLLQKYGDTDEILFGLISGSYAKSKSGGVLRKNIGPMSDEVNVSTDGTFKVPTGGSIINTINKFRIYGYSNNDGTYFDGTGSDDCKWGKSSFNNGQCSNWGNPQSEIYLEALRYLAGKSASSTFNCDDNSRIPGLVTATWKDPLSADNWCAPLTIIDFNASTSSYDGDELSGAVDIGQTSVSATTNAIGDSEGITGNNYFVGSNGINNDQLCTAKTVTALGSVSGTCPDAPRLSGSYNIAGLASYARTHDIRSDLQGTQYINTYGVALAPAVPELTLAVPGSNTKTVTILPACRDSSVGGNCAIVDFKIVTPYKITGGVGTGKAYVNWEDSEQGGDYDQDMWGVITYSVTSSSISVTTNVVAQSTPYEMGFGYIIGGTTKDGFHAHSGINSFSFTDPTGANACSNCTFSDAASTNTYMIGTPTVSLLEQPLWYAAKWGGFAEAKNDANNKLDKTSEWDSDGNGTPDKYFYATNPRTLQDSLDKVFLAVAATKSSSASVVANSVTLETGTRIYQAQFDSGDWTGTIKSFPISTINGSILASDWDAASLLDQLNYDNGRTVITYNPTTAKGAPFRWASIDSNEQKALNTNPATGNADGLGPDRLNFLRGYKANELQNGGNFRDRTHVLGDIIHSTPYYVGTPDFNYPDSLEPVAYSTFKAAIAALNGGTGRTPALYVGADDGMLHGFNAKTGNELMAFVPSAVYANLPQLARIDYSHRYFVDGTPTVVDGFGYFGSCSAQPCWRSVLASGLGAGGKEIFALDVTDPDNFSESNASSTVLWEIKDTTSGFADLGYTFSHVAIVKLANGEWGAIFGNGFHSTTGKAILYIVKLSDGSLIKEIDTGIGSTTDPNGLASPAVVDINNDKVADYVYAGDLQGNMWKIDISSTNTSQWGIPFTNKGKPAPLFTAIDSSGNPQPITSYPQVSTHPDGQGGYMIYFGTGKYYETGDNDPTNATTQTLYGIWDKDDGKTYGYTRSDLLQQTVLATVIVNNTKWRITSDNPIAWRTSSNTTGHMGWYMDLPETGERTVDEPILRNGRIIFTTMTPSLHACDYGGSSWLMELNPSNGGRLDFSPFDTNGDAVFTTADYVQSPVDINGDGVVDTNDKVWVSGKQPNTGIIKKPTVISAGNKEFKYSSGTKDAAIDVTTESPGTGDKGRISWEQLK